MVKDIVIHDCDGLRHYTTDYFRGIKTTLNSGVPVVLPFGTWYELFVNERNDNMTKVLIKVYTFVGNDTCYIGETWWLLTADEMPFETCIEFAHEFVKAYRDEKNILDKLINRRGTK